MVGLINQSIDNQSIRLTTLNSMRASDELTPEQGRQMAFDLEVAYNAYNKYLHEGH